MGNKGLSLIEMLIAIAILGILFTALTAFFISQNRQYILQKETVAMQDNARAAMDFVVRMLRNSSSKPPEVSGTECDYTLKFKDAWNNAEHEFRRYDSSTDGPDTLGYHHDTATGNIDPLALNITCFEVIQNGSKFDIKITAETARVLPGLGQKGSITLESTVRPRNL